MGVLRFIVHPASRLEGGADVRQAYLTTLELGVVSTTVTVENQVITCVKETDESARLHIRWRVEGSGWLMLSTASLIEREDPYLLPLELARGKLVQVRNLLAAWEAEGLQGSPQFFELFNEAHRHFARAISLQTDPSSCGSEAEQAIFLVIGAAKLLSQARTEFNLLHRKRSRDQSLHCLLGTTINTRGLSGSDEQEYLDAFNSLAVSFDWSSVQPEQELYCWEVVDRQLAWSELHRLIPKGGPLLNLGSGGLPDWLGSWKNDPRNFRSFISDFVETSLDRYSGRIRLWEIAAYGNSGGALNLREDQRLEIVAAALDLARHRDPESQLILRVDQPWGEYQSRGQHRLSPLQFADALLRAGLGLGGLNLEVAVGYVPRGSAPRDPLDWLKLIEYWSSLRVPLFVTLVCPSSNEEDPNSFRASSSSPSMEVSGSEREGGWTSEIQRDWMEKYVPLLLADKSVSGVFWEHFSDAGPHLFPNGGLLDRAGKPKPALEKLKQLRESYL